MNRTRLISLLIAALALSLLVPPAATADDAPPERTPSGFYDASVIEKSGKGAVKPGAQPMQVDDGGGGGTCFAKQLERSEGVWPYARRLYNYTDWCGRAGLITYRSTSAWTHHDFMCWNTGGPYVTRTAGGAGWTLVQVQVSVNVACHTPWWFDAHDTLMMRVNYYPNGYYQTVAWD